MVRVRSLDDAQFTVFAGRVPYGANSASMPIVATDTNGQYDEETIQIIVFPASTLADTISGTLTRDHSPYVALHDICVPAGDSLTIDPGVQIQFDSLGYPATMHVTGRIVANGHPNDSVLFRSLDNSRWQGISMHGQTASGELSYCYFADALCPLQIDSANRFKLMNSSIVAPASEWSTNSIMLRAPCDSTVVKDCNFVLGNLMSVSGRFLIVNSIFESEHDGRLSLSTEASGQVSRCEFFTSGGFRAVDIRNDATNVQIDRCQFTLSNGTNGVSVMDNFEGRPRSLSIINNTFANDGGDFVFIGTHSSFDDFVIDNNIFCGARRHALRVFRGFDSSRVEILNNCFWNNQSDFFADDTTQWTSLGTLTETNINGDSTDQYGNIFLNPVFADTLWHLTENSPCRDAGMNVGFPYEGPAPDIGLWEYGLVESSGDHLSPAIPVSPY